MRAMLIVMAMLATAGAAIAQSNSSTQDQAKDAYTTCLMIAAQGADDQKSSPAAVARDILKTCRPDFDRVVDTYTRGVSPQDKATVRAKAMADSSYLNNAVMIVREVRTRRGKPGSR